MCCMLCASESCIALNCPWPVQFLSTIIQLLLIRIVAFIHTDYLTPSPCPPPSLSSPSPSPVLLPVPNTLPPSPLLPSPFLPPASCPPLPPSSCPAPPLSPSLPSLPFYWPLGPNEMAVLRWNSQHGSVFVDGSHLKVSLTFSSFVALKAYSYSNKTIAEKIDDIWLEIDV